MWRVVGVASDQSALSRTLICKSVPRGQQEDQMLPPKLDQIKSMLTDCSRLTLHQAELSAELTHLDANEGFEGIVHSYLRENSGIAAPTRVSPSQACPCCGRPF